MVNTIDVVLSGVIKGGIQSSHNKLFRQPNGLNLIYSTANVKMLHNCMQIISHS